MMDIESTILEQAGCEQAVVYSEMADVGQTPMQLPHSPQVSESTQAACVSALIEIDSNGHDNTHSPQAVQFSWSISAVISLGGYGLRFDRRWRERSLCLHKR